MSAWVHDLNPFLVEFAPGIGVRWYGLAYLIGFVLAYVMIRALSRRGLALVPPEAASDLVFYLALGTVAGGRLGYCLFYSPHLFLEFSSSVPFWGALAVHHGGMSSHGGMAGIALACWLYGRKYKVSILHVGDLASTAGPLGILFGRIANFVNGELVGRICPPATSAWCVKFPQDILAWPGSEPRRLGTLSPVAQQLGVSPEQWAGVVRGYFRDAAAGDLLDRTLGRILEAIQAGNEQVRASIGPLLDARYPSQLYEALGEGLILFLAVVLIWARPRKPGVITGCFFAIYGVARIVCEVYRMPDAHIGLNAFGLSRGQMLSFIPIAVGIWMAWYCNRRPVEKVGGWADRRRGA